LNVFVTSTYTNATTGQTSITGLSFAVGASTNYAISCHLVYQGSATTTAPVWSSTGPASPTQVTVAVKDVTTSGASTVWWTGASHAASFAFALGPAAIVTTGADLEADIQIGLRNGTTAGTFQLTGAASGTGTLTVQTGSFCTVQ
jgi:hypothetical protein